MAAQRRRPGAVGPLCLRMSDNVTAQNENLVCEPLTRNTLDPAGKVYRKKWRAF